MRHVGAEVVDLIGPADVHLAEMALHLKPPFISHVMACLSVRRSKSDQHPARPCAPDPLPSR